MSSFELSRLPYRGGFQKGRMIVDLSASKTTLPPTCEENFALYGTTSGGRVAASKRRPANSLRKSLISPNTAFDQSSSHDGSSYDDSSKNFVSSTPVNFSEAPSHFPEQNDTQLTPTYALTIQKFQESQYPVYEPLIDSQFFFSQSHNFLEKSLEYLKELEEEIIKKQENEELTVLVSKTVDYIHMIHLNWYTVLEEINEIDIKIIALVKKLEKMHSELYEVQRKWIEENAIESRENVNTDPNSPPDYHLPPWATKHLKKLEQVEKMKQGILELFEIQRSLGSQLENQLIGGLIEVARLMRGLGFEPDPQDLRWRLLISKTFINNKIDLCTSQSQNANSKLKNSDAEDNTDIQLPDILENNSIES